MLISCGVKCLFLQWKINKVMYMGHVGYMEFYAKFETSILI
jgi:hypothetical protein